MARIVREAESSVIAEADARSVVPRRRIARVLRTGRTSAPPAENRSGGQNYCAYSALLDDPMLKDLRKETAFNEVLTKGSNCQALVKQGQ